MNIDIPAGLSDAALWAIILGFVSPLALQFILQSKWSARVQAVVAFLFSLVVGVVTAYFAGAFTGVGLVTTILLVFVVTISTYKGFWKQVTPNLKNATSATKVEAEPLPVLAGVVQVQETPTEAAPVAYDAAAPIAAPEDDGPKHSL